jgi:23S rRNA (adenine2503-C2)-methyltransferase
MMNEMKAAVTKLESMNERPPLVGQSLEELKELAVSLGEPSYRGAQIYRELYARRETRIEKMTALPGEMRRRLEEIARIGLPEIVRRHRSSDGTVRYVLRCAGRGAPAAGSAGAARDAMIETVFMPEEKRQTICVSTQEGCAVNCQFCLTATLGLVRNLAAGEIVGQILVALEDNREELKPQTNVVLMGQGEPLLNYEAVMKALRIILDAKGLGISPKHATLSTSGIVPGIERLGREKVRPKLAISLNASTDEQRDAIMPINRKYPLAKLMEACRNYPLRPWEHLTFEYVLLGGFNDSVEDARRVAKLLVNLRAKVNLIPWNPGELPYRPPDAASTEAFRKCLVEKGQRAFVRYSRGQDVMAACGQLALVETRG